MNNIFSQIPTVTKVRNIKITTQSELTETENKKNSHYNKTLPYRNRLLKASSALILVIIKLQQNYQPEDINQFRYDLLTYVTELHQVLNAEEVNPSIIEKTSFVLCAALDEAILNTSWGEDSGWSNFSLLSTLFKERDGGEQFFILLNRAIKKTEVLNEFIELLFYLLSLGFKGMYRAHPELLVGVYRTLENILNKSNGNEIADKKNKIKKANKNIGLLAKPKKMWRHGTVFLFVSIFVLCCLIISEIYYNNEKIPIFSAIEEASYLTR